MKGFYELKLNLRDFYGKLNLYQTGFIANGMIPFYNILALTRKICGILSKKLQKLALLKLLSNSSVKTTVFCYFFDIPQILQVLVSGRYEDNYITI